MMKRTIGAFEAKTHFSQLLKEVENGTEIHVTHRGRAVAVLRSEDADNAQSAAAVLDRIASRRRAIQERESLTDRDIAAFREEGHRF